MPSEIFDGEEFGRELSAIIKTYVDGQVQKLRAENTAPKQKSYDWLSALRFWYQPLAAGRLR
jgi:hypothetical protein